MLMQKSRILLAVNTPDLVVQVVWRQYEFEGLMDAVLNSNVNQGLCELSEILNQS